jgi:hypothetical protein
MQFIEETLLKIPTSLLFSEINANRQSNGKHTVEDTQLASRLSILMAINTQKYISFKGVFIYLSEYQLIVLESVIYKYLDVNLYNTLPRLAMPDEKPATIELPSPDYLQKRSFLQRVKAFFS